LGGSMAVLLLTYEYTVRYTFIGALLNGRKRRSTSASIEPETLTPAVPLPNVAPR
jgi:hypothetical protein